jgi:hypothetical protein
MSLLRGVGLPNQFSHKAAKDLAGFASSYNSASQVVAWASADGATTGTKLAFLNGEAFVMPADAAFDWSADPQLGAWVTATSYDAYDMRYVTDKDGKKHYYQCIASHTSGAANKPGVVGEAWTDYWKESDQTAEPAVGTVLANGQSVWVLVLATADGELTVVKAGDVALDAAVECKIPKFEPEMFVPMALILVDAAGAVTLGTTDISGIVTITQCTFPVYPHPDNL